MMDQQSQNTVLKETRPRMEQCPSCQGVGVILVGNDNINKGNCSMCDGAGMILLRDAENE